MREQVKGRAELCAQDSERRDSVAKFSGQVQQHAEDTMPSYFSYIGKLNSPGFFWNDIPPEANSRATHPRRSYRRTFLSVSALRPKLSVIGARRRAWKANSSIGEPGSLLARKSDLEAIWKEAKEWRWRDQKEWQEYWEEIEALPEDEMYVLVVAENP